MASSMSSAVVWRLSRCAGCGVVFIACCSLTTTALASISLPLSSTISSTLLRRLCRCSRSGSLSQGGSSSPWGACWRRSLRNQSLAGQMHLPPTLQRRRVSPPPLTLPSLWAVLWGCCWVWLLGVAVSRAGCSNSSTQMSLAHPSTSVALSVVVVVVAATVDAVAVIVAAVVVVVVAVDTARLHSCYTFVTCVVSPRSMAMLLLTASVWIPRRCLP